MFAIFWTNINQFIVDWIIFLDILIIACWLKKIKSDICKVYCVVYWKLPADSLVGQDDIDRLVSLHYGYCAIPINKDIYTQLYRGDISWVCWNYNWFIVELLAPVWVCFCGQRINNRCLENCLAVIRVSGFRYWVCMVSEMATASSDDIVVRTFHLSPILTWYGKHGWSIQSELVHLFSGTLSKWQLFDIQISCHGDDNWFSCYTNELWN